MNLLYILSGDALSVTYVTDIFFCPVICILILFMVCFMNRSFTFWFCQIFLFFFHCFYVFF